MQNINLIFEKYHKGNIEQRLYLYLEFRELRYFFEQIEKQENSKTQQLKIIKEETVHSASHYRRVIRWCYALMS
jgi:hypothetical protein